MITSIGDAPFFFKAVQGLGKLEGHKPLTDPFVSEKEEAVNDPVVEHGPLKPFDRFLVADDVFK